MVIYKTTNLIDGKIYVGKDKKNNPSYIGSGIRLINAVKKHGKQNFEKEILEVCSDEKTLNDREIYWINYYKSYDKSIGYNITMGGEGGNTRKFYSEYELEEYKNKLSVGVSSSDRYKKFVEKRRGIKNPKHSQKLKELYASGKLIPHNLGKQNSPETRAKISAKNKGRKFSIEIRKKMGVSNRKKVDMFDLHQNFIRSFDSIQQASETMKIGRDSVYGCCIGKYKQGGGYIWKYK
jgi:group I intron endonuclease